MTTFIIVPFVGSAAALAGAFLGARGAFCGAAVGIGAAALWVVA